MAVPFTFTPSTIIESGQVNSNFTYTDYTAIDNNKSIQWKNTSAALSASIKQDSSNNLVFNNADGFFNFTGARVGINDSNPDYRLHVNSGTDNIAAVFESTDSTAAIELRDNASGIGYVRVQALGNALQFSANNSIYGQFTSAGNLELLLGSDLYVYNGGSTKAGILDHDGSNFIIKAHTASGDIYMRPENGNFRVYESIAGTDYIRAGHSGTEAFVTSSNDFLKLYTGYVSMSLGDVVDPDIVFEGQSSSQFILRDGYDLVIEEAGGSGAGVMYHDGTHFWFETTVGTDDLIFDATNGTGQFTIIQPTDNIKFVDASDTGGTVSGYLQLNVGGSTRYIRLNTTA